MKITAKKREVLGKKVKNLRNEGLVPASVYGPKMDSMNIQIDAKDFRKVFKDSGFSKFIDLEVEGDKSRKVLVKNLDIHPLKDHYVHVGFYLIDEDTKITVEVPVHVLGNSPAVKNNLGFLVLQLETIKLHCLPKDLPQYVEINIDGLEQAGNSINVGEVVLPADVELDSSMDSSTSIIYIASAQKEEVEEVVAPVEGAEAPVAEGAAAPAEEKKE
jgi:large subunit ribosomal protein L25